MVNFYRVIRNLPSVAFGIYKAYKMNIEIETSLLGCLRCGGYFRVRGFSYVIN